MALKNRLPYSQRLFFLLVFFAGILMSGFILFQYEREKQFKIENLNIQLQLLNAQIIDAINNGKSLDKITLHFQNRYPDLRLTLIDTTGVVLYDAPNEWKNDSIPNHYSRQEVMQAINEGEGYTIRRRSENEKGDYFYSATRVGPTIVRSALPYNVSLTKLLTADFAFLWIMIGLTVIMCIFGYFAIRHIGQSIKRLQEFANLASRNERIENIKPFPNDELGEISQHIVQLYSQLQQTTADRNREHAMVLHEEQEKIRLKRQLTNNINHELKTPVSSIQGYLETIINNPDMNEETRRLFIEKSYMQSERLRQLLQDISTITRMDEASQLIERENVDIHAIVQDIIAEVALRPADKRMRINCNFDRELPIFGNANLLTSIFRNLTENAIAYSGGRDIFINLTKETPEEYVFSFADNGIGIDSQHLSHIFERFYRVDKGRSRKLGGTGLGLSIVKNAVLFHGGNIEAHNLYDGGLEFIFSLKKTNPSTT